MSQNIYDDPDFFAGYSLLRRSIDGLAGAPEWPTVRSTLPDTSGANVVDLGCGFGWFCRWAADHGARSVLGVDISERMLDRARRNTPSDQPIEYRSVDLEHLTLPNAGFDVVYSSLAIHYVADIDRLFDTVRHGLRHGGTFTCSIEHPIRTAPPAPGFVGDGPSRSWPLDHYLVEGPRTLDWIAADVVKHHRTVSRYVTALLDRGFTLTHLAEWCPSDAELEAEPSWRDELHRPSFLILGATG